MTNIEPQDNGTYKDRRPVTFLAALGIILVTGGSVGALAYDAIINGNQPSLAQLGTFGTLALGALIALAGGKKSGE